MARYHKGMWRWCQKVDRVQLLEKRVAKGGIKGRRNCTDIIGVFAAEGDQTTVAIDRAQKCGEPELVAWSVTAHPHEFAGLQVFAEHVDLIIGITEHQITGEALERQKL